MLLTLKLVTISVPVRFMCIYSQTRSGITGSIQTCIFITIWDGNQLFKGKRCSIAPPTSRFLYKLYLAIYCLFLSLFLSFITASFVTYFIYLSDILFLFYSPLSICLRLSFFSFISLCPSDIFFLCFRLCLSFFLLVLPFFIFNSPF